MIYDEIAYAGTCCTAPRTVRPQTSRYRYAVVTAPAARANSCLGLADVSRAAGPYVMET